MAFLGVYRALYDYAPQAEGELQISEGDLLYVLEKSEDDDWWKAKKKASEDEEDEPSGLIPSNYIEEVGGTRDNGAVLLKQVANIDFAVTTRWSRSSCLRIHETNR
jgi:hypothetical protein